MTDRLTCPPKPTSPIRSPTAAGPRGVRGPAGREGRSPVAGKAVDAAAREQRIREAEERQSTYREAEAREREALADDACAKQAREAAETAERDAADRAGREYRVQFNIRLAQTQAADKPEKRDRRERLANLCRYLLADAAGQPPLGADPTRGLRLSPRVRQTLNRLLVGDSEKQVATALGVSIHTVHVYIKALYGALGVNSRAEMLAKFVRPPGA